MNAADRLHMQLTTLLPATSRRWLRLIDMRLAGSGFELTASTMVPLVLIGRSHGINQITLADQLGVVGPSLVRTLDKLAEMGLIRREIDPDDRRVNTLCLTDEGQALASRIEAHMVQVRREIFAGIPAADIEAALRVHRALVDALASDGQGEADH